MHARYPADGFQVGGLLVGGLSIATRILSPRFMATNRYQRTREDHSREVAEDYVELIDAIIQERGKARAVDLATRLGISHVTVTKTVQRLIREGLVTSEPYRNILLTKTGKALAETAR